MTHMRRILAPSSVATVAAALLLPAALAGQTDIRLSPRVGWLDPVGAFGEAAALDDGNWVSYDEVGGMALLGADLTMASSPHWGMRIGMATTVGGQATGVWDCRDQACPDILLRVPSDVSVAVATADVMLTPPVALLGVRPFLLGGGGIVRHRFEFDPLSDEAITLEPGGDTRYDPAVHFGVGARWEGRSLALEVGVEDLVSWPDRPSGGSQHAVAISAGFGIRMR